MRDLLLSRLTHLTRLDSQLRGGGCGGRHHRRRRWRWRNPRLGREAPQSTSRAEPVLLGGIRPRERPAGRVVYLKLAKNPSFLGTDTGLIEAYACRHPEFPQESTAGQYFELGQLRAYRALGLAAGRRLPGELPA